MTKAALNQLVQNLVIDLSPVQIRINAVSPGATMTERTEKDANYLQEWSRLTPLGKPADVQDISEAVCFFLSDKAKHITGQTLIVDGGWTSVSPPPQS
jgi:3-oxoacyl-[acyl-carrier protein] reductase